MRTVCKNSLCEKLFKTYPSRIKKGSGKYCSRSCASKCNIEVLTKLHLSRRGKAVVSNWGKGHTPWNKGLKGFMAGEKHYKWQEKPSYQAVHSWIRKTLGKPNECKLCKRTYSKRFEWANLSGKYKREIGDWIRLCKSCHNIFDDTGKKSWETRRGGAAL